MASKSAPESTDQSIEYITMVKCASSILDCIKSSPNSIGTAMFAEGYISEYVRDIVGATSVSGVDKAQQLLNTITDRVKTDPLAYNGFVEIIRNEGTWACCYLERLQKVYEELSLEVQQIEEQCSDDSFHSLPEADELPSLKIDAYVNTSQGFICPFCQRCSFESFLENGCPHAEATEKLECKAFFPFLDCSKIDPEDKKDLEWHLLQDYQKILKSYARLENSLINSLESSEVNIEKLDNFVWNLVLPPQTQPQKRVEKAETVTAIFKSIRPHKSFFNCDIVEEVSKEFGRPADKKIVAEYVAALNEYCKRSVFEIPPVFFQHASERNDRKLFAFKYTPGNPVTLGDVQIIRRKIASILGINARLLQLCSIREGCVKMVFLVPEFVVEVINSISVKQTSALTDFHIKIVPVIDSHKPHPDSITVSDIKKVESKLNKKGTLLSLDSKHHMSNLSPYDPFHSDQRSTISSGYGSITDDVLPKHQSATMFQLSLPNEVTTIVAGPNKGTVRDAVQPWLEKYSYDSNIIELRYMQNFCRINMDLSADILTGQHVIAIKAKNNFIATFPDQEDKILPADSSKSVKDVLVSVLGDMDRKFEVYCEGSPVPLKLSANASLLAGLRVNVKHLSQSDTTQDTADSTLAVRSSVAEEHQDDDDLLDPLTEDDSDRAILHSDRLSDQRASISGDSSVVNKRRSKKSRSVKKYSKRTARTFEIVREVNEKGEMGKCGFFLHSERPPVIRQIVPGGPTDKVGLKNDDVVVAVNGINVENFTHDEVFNLFTKNPDPIISLTVCKPAEPHYSAFRQFDPSNMTVQVGTNESIIRSPSTSNQEDAPSHKTDDQ